VKEQDKTVGKRDERRLIRAINLVEHFAAMRAFPLA